MVKEKRNDDNNEYSNKQQQKTLKDIKKRNPLNWGVLDLPESVQHKDTPEE
ncbi:hypothetical protein [Bacillus sp. USDA818B3_A]|uniref:hypothetical protein n=1 Tax=Bacillus sp. USDA818B3_A TaxID=2698834 RepID=UPI0013692260|nr:hypothetical protein [Bacillus sp. USDA818B3_A]